MRIVVTGASGNVGSEVVPALLAHPDVTSVVGIARRPPTGGDGVQWHALDIAADDLTHAFQGADVVVHLAWLLQPSHQPEEMERVNVLGTSRVLDALQECGVPALVHASSVGAYSPGPKDRRVDESHPTGGIPSSTYSRHKSAVEGILDELELRRPDLRIVRMRPGLIFQAAAASAIARYFLGRLVPQSLVRRALLPVVPALPRLAFQGVHSSDMAQAYVQACVRDVRGAFNIAAEPVLDADALATALGARTVPLPAWLARGLIDLTWRLRLQPTDAGWLDLALQTPLLNTTRARTELGWEPLVSATDALVELVDAMGKGEGGATPVLRPRRARA